MSIPQCPHNIPWNEPCPKCPEDQPGITEAQRDQNLDAFAQRVKEWASSPEGQESLTEALRESKAMAKRLEDAQRIDPADLHKPMTI